MRATEMLKKNSVAFAKMQRLVLNYGDIHITGVKGVSLTIYNQGYTVPSNHFLGEFHSFGDTHIALFDPSAVSG